VYAYLLLGLALVLAVLVIGRLFVIADPTILARIAKVTLIILAVIAAVYLLLRGQTLLASIFGGGAAVIWRFARFVPPWALFRLWQSARAHGRSRRYAGGGGARRGGGRASKVETAWLSMSLDHASGEIDGTIRQGPFAGRALNALDRDELFALLHAVRGDDAHSAQLIEAYIERSHEDWREDYATFEAKAGGARGHSAGTSGEGPMSREEALDVLGLVPGASEIEIKEAHRRLMKRYHPDQGGSDYIATQINRAKDVLLDDSTRPA
jgi:hypothetical protein